MGDGRKNMRLKNITFMSPMSHSTSNISSVIEETQRMLLTSGNRNNGRYIPGRYVPERYIPGKHMYKRKYYRGGA